MKREFRLLFKQRYPYIIVAAVLALIFILVGHLSFVSMAEDTSDSVYSNFISHVEYYETRAELQELYDDALKDLEKNGPSGKPEIVDGIEYWGSTPPEYLVAVYGFLLEKDLPYDSIVEFERDAKYTPFHYFCNYSMVFGYFIIIASIVIGSMYQSLEVMSKMSKMVYSTGKKRLRIIDSKYAVSLFLVLAVTLLADIIMAISASALFPNSGAIYCVMFSGRKLISLNFFQYFLMNIASHLIMATLLYTINYYLSVMCKNGIIILCAGLVSIILANLITLPTGHFENMVSMAILGGFNAVLYMPHYFTRFENIALIVPYIVLAVVIALISRPVIKRMDYSR